MFNGRLDISNIHPIFAQEYSIGSVNDIQVFRSEWRIITYNSKTEK